MRYVVPIAGILLVGGYMIIRENSEKDADLAWIAKSFKATPASIASDSRAHRS